jgi:hypothetical protein
MKYLLIISLVLIILAVASAFFRMEATPEKVKEGAVKVGLLGEVTKIEPEEGVSCFVYKSGYAGGISCLKDN